MILDRVDYDAVVVLELDDFKRTGADDVCHHPIAAVVIERLFGEDLHRLALVVQLVGAPAHIPVVDRHLNCLIIDRFVL